MRKIILGIVTSILLFFICASGWIEPIFNFFVWLVTLNLTASSVSIAGEIFVKIATFTISYWGVGLIFQYLGFFNSNMMKVAYFVISTLVSFFLCYIVMLLETHLLFISIIVGIMLILVIALTILVHLRKNKR